MIMKIIIIVKQYSQLRQLILMVKQWRVRNARRDWLEKEKLTAAMDFKKRLTNYEIELYYHVNGQYVLVTGRMQVEGAIV
jgi:hypothetical protein